MWWLYAHLCIYTCIIRPETDWEVFHHHVLPYLLRQWLSENHNAFNCLDWLVCSLRGYILILPSCSSCFFFSTKILMVWTNIFMLAFHVLYHLSCHLSSSSDFRCNPYIMSKGSLIWSYYQDFLCAEFFQEWEMVPERCMCSHSNFCFKYPKIRYLIVMYYYHCVFSYWTSSLVRYHRIPLSNWDLSNLVKRQWNW